MPLLNFQVPRNVKYHIIMTTDPTLNLDSVCLMSSGVIEQSGYLHYMTTDNSFNFNRGQPGQSYFLNVIAEVVDFSSIDDDELIVYQPTYISLPLPRFYSRLFMWIIITLAILITAVAVYNWKCR
mmetsp:Transcript_30197/g.29493  ORF Transcript_30197/g.29493 Transcript_30197/m.29493 type:complete len:125 (+) Transcript_30197:331-705(+)